MKLSFKFKNIQSVPSDILSFFKEKFKKIEKITKKEGEAFVNVELIKNKETKENKGLYKVKIFFDTPKRSAIVIYGFGKNFYQAISKAFKKLSSLVKRSK